MSTPLRFYFDFASPYACFALRPPQAVDFAVADNVCGSPHMTSMARGSLGRIVRRNLPDGCRKT
jgi:2-hydroxychromene-2-carboxylate isomerase